MELDQSPNTISTRQLHRLGPSLSSLLCSGPQETVKDPSCHAFALLSCLNVGESKVYAFENARDDHVIGGIRETLIHAGLLRGLGDCGCHREAHFVCSEETTQNPRYRAGHIV